MNEEIEYAEMLEIPVSTVNVVKKKNRRVRGKNQPNLKERLISRVNDRVGNDSYAEEGAYSAPASAMPWASSVWVLVGAVAPALPQHRETTTTFAPA